MRECSPRRAARAPRPRRKMTARRIRQVKLVLASSRILLFLFASVTPLRAETSLPTAPTTLPAGLGVNIHFTRPRPGEMERLAAAGVTFVRVDFSWTWGGKERGKE